MVEYINQFKISLLRLICERKVIADQQHQITVRQRLQVGSDDEVAELIKNLLYLRVRLLFEAVQARLIVPKRLNEVVEELTLLKTVVDVCHMRQYCFVLAVFAKRIGPEEIHIPRIFQLVLDFVADSVQECVLELASKEQWRHRRRSKGINLPQRVDLSFQKWEGLVHPI